VVRPFSLPLLTCFSLYSPLRAYFSAPSYPGALPISGGPTILYIFPPQVVLFSLPQSFLNSGLDVRLPFSGSRACETFSVHWRAIRPCLSSFSWKSLSSRSSSRSCVVQPPTIFRLPPLGPLLYFPPLLRFPLTFLFFSFFSETTPFGRRCWCGVGWLMGVIPGINLLAVSRPIGEQGSLNSRLFFLMILPAEISLCFFLRSSLAGTCRLLGGAGASCRETLSVYLHCGRQAFPRLKIFPHTVAISDPFPLCCAPSFNILDRR